jgi:hypothetical protein
VLTNNDDTYPNGIGVMPPHWARNANGAHLKRRSFAAEIHGGQKGTLTKGLGWAMCAHLLCIAWSTPPRTEGPRMVLAADAFCECTRGPINYSVRYGKSPMWRTTITLIR